MTISRWLLQVYEMSNLPAQESAVSILSAVPDLHVDARSYERGDFLIVDCPDTNQAMTVYELMLMADSEAELIHSVASPDEVRSVREQLVSQGEPAQPSRRDLLDA